MLKPLLQTEHLYFLSFKWYAIWFFNTNERRNFLSHFSQLNFFSYGLITLISFFIKSCLSMIEACYKANHCVERRTSTADSSPSDFSIVAPCVDLCVLPASRPPTICNTTFNHGVDPRSSTDDGLTTDRNFKPNHCVDLLIPTGVGPSCVASSR